MSNGTTTWTYTYDSDGLRTGRTNGTTTYTYVYSGSQLSWMTVSDGTVDIEMHFTYDASGRPLAVVYNGIIYYYALNLQGDVVAILNSAGSAVVNYTYDAWGKPLTTTGSKASTLGQDNPLRYRGYVYDSETQLYYLQSRYYNPEWGRFINADALVSTGQGVLGNNMFAYCNNNPANCVDTTGLLPVSFRIQQVAGDGTKGGIIQGFSDDSNPKNTPPDHPNYVPPKEGPQKKRNPNGKGWGWEDKNGDVWVWTPGMHGGPGWTVQEPGGGHWHGYPGGSVRKHCESVLDNNYLLDVFPSISHDFTAQSIMDTVLFGGGALGLAVMCDLLWNRNG